MKNVINSVISYVVNIIIAIFLSFSFVYALTTTLRMTYGANDVLMLVCFVSALCSIAFASRLSVKIFAVASALAVAGGLFYFLKKPSLFNLVHSRTVSTFLWLEGYINGEVALSMEYQNYTLLAFSLVISLAVYLLTVKRFNFYVLLIGGVSLFVAQWMLEYFVSYLSFYVFVFFILVCYFKHIYLRNTEAGQSASRQAPASFLLLSAPLCALIFLLAYYMPASDKPIEWDWMDSKLQSVQSYVKTGLNIGTEYFEISSTGFGEERLRLGGNVRLDDTLVMTVDSPEGDLYLKGAVKELYTGSSWKSLDSGLTDLGQKLQLNDFNTDLLEVIEGSRLIPRGINVINALFNRTSINITYENLTTKTLFIPAKTERLTFEAGPLNVLLDAYDMPSSENFLGKQFNYTVDLYSMKKNNESVAVILRNSSRLYNRSIETQATLRRSVVLRRDVTRLAQRSRDVHTRYLQLPAELPERVGELALEISSSANNDYDRVKAIESYLAKNYRYTLEPGTTPEGRDFVDYFLFDQKQGYCTYYASAMTVLARSIGIPARYVEGYVLPSQPVLGTTYEVTNEQAHAWVEVYFEGFGWIPFEPTASSQDFNGTPEQTSSALNTPDQPIPEQNNPADDVTTGQDASGASPVSADMGTGIGARALAFIKLAGPAFLVLLLWATAFSPLRRRFRLYRLQRLTPQQGVLEMYRHFLRALSVQGLQMKPGETPLQYAHRIDESLDFKPLSFKTVTDTFIKARYSNNSIDEKERQLIIDFYRSFPAQCKQRTGWLRYFVYNNLLGLI